MKLKYRIRNWFKKVFTCHLEQEIDKQFLMARETDSLALYWEDVAKGLLPMPDKDANIPWLAEKAFCSIVMRKHAEMGWNQPGNRFRFTDVSVPGNPLDPAPEDRRPRYGDDYFRRQYPTVPTEPIPEGRDDGY